MHTHSHAHTHTYTHILCPLPPEKDEDEGMLGPDGASIHSRPRSNYCGIEVVSKLKIGTRIRRGPDWNWGVQVRAGSLLIHSVMNTEKWGRPGNEASQILHSNYILYFVKSVAV